LSHPSWSGITYGVCDVEVYKDIAVKIE